MPRSPLVAVRLSYELLADLDAAVEATGTSRSEVITEALVNHLESAAVKLVRGRPKPPSELKA